MRNEVFEACKKAKEKGGYGFWPELAKEYGYDNPEALRSAFRSEARKRGMYTTNKVREEIGEFRKYADGTYSSDRLVEIFEGDLNNDRALLKAHNLDPDAWTLIESTSNMWHAQRIKDRGRLVQFQSKIRVKPKSIQDINTEDLLKRYESTMPVLTKKFPAYKSSDKCVLDINTGDWHIGARLYNKNWNDLEELFPNMMSDIFNRIENYKNKFTKIYFNLMGDIFHFQGRQQQTERHLQTVEGNGMNPLEMFDVALSLCIPAIEKLLEFAPVEMLYIPGNHDGDTMYYLLCTLKSHFRDAETFSVDLDKASRKARLIGKNLRGWEHGEMNKKNRVHWLQNDFAELWGQSVYRETFGGHWHHEEVIEHGGVKLRLLPSVAVKDFWHHRNGYNGAIRATMSFVWEEDRIGWADIWQSTGF